MNDADIDVRLRGKTYVVGVGVQKAGTSWLHQYLASQPQICMSGRKELHYFDGHFGVRSRTPMEAAIVQALKRQLEKFEPGLPLTYTEKLKETVDLLRMQYDENGYSGYFARIVKDRKFFGEVTPAYCLIGQKGFAHMKSLFPQIKVIYLMRDPIDRHFSLLRMTEEGRQEPGFARRNFLPLLEKGFAVQMSDYQSHLQALRSVFTDGELFIGFYETLFSDAEISRLCNFIGIDFAAAPYETKINKSNVADELDPALARKALVKLAPVYEYCRRTFPDLPACWRG